MMEVAEKTLKLRVITPDSVVFEGEADSVKLPIYNGYMGILPNHAPFIAPLGTGILTVEGKEPKEMFISNGFVQVGGNEVRVVCDVGETAEAVDLARAQEAEKRARERLAAGIKAEIDRPRAAAALQRSLVRQMLVERHRRRRSESAVR